MFHTLVSYLSRFTKFFVLAFIVAFVLAVVLFTIRFAENDDATTVDSPISAPIAEDEAVATEEEVASAIDLDSADTAVVVTTGTDTPAGEDAGFVSSTMTTLPSTGIGSMVATTLGFVVLSAGTVSYFRSRKTLSAELLEANR